MAGFRCFSGGDHNPSPAAQWPKMSENVMSRAFFPIGSRLGERGCVSAPCLRATPGADATGLAETKHLSLTQSGSTSRLRLAVRAPILQNQLDTVREEDFVSCSIAP